jgi:ABC-type lipoprotein export system ATPase subunit
MIALLNISKRYKTSAGLVQAMDGVSLTAQAGEMVCIAGPSGCGKTTLLLTVGGLLEPDSGSASLANQDIYKLTPQQRAKLRGEAIGFVFQQFHLIPYLTVLENIQAPCLALPSSSALGRARELGEQLGLGDRLGHMPAQLSTGQRQRVALARAMLNHPKVILADEPTGNLDQASAEVVIRHLSAFSAGGGTVLLVTHDQQATLNAHRVLHMRQGRLVEP